MSNCKKGRARLICSRKYLFTVLAVLARYAGVDYNSPRSEVAARVAIRSTIEAHSLETLMRQCEETINGAPTTWRQAIDLVGRLREVERSLGLRMRSREIRQAAEKVSGLEGAWEQQASRRLIRSLVTLGTQQARTPALPAPLTTLQFD
jgi:hypothetical protein